MDPTLNHTASPSSKSEDAPEPAKRAEQLEHEIEEIRNNLGGLVTELDHRRHRLNPMNIVGRNPWPFAVGGVVAVGMAIGAVAWYQSRARARDSWMNRGKRLQSALRRAVDKPEKVAKAEPNIGMKVLSTAATAVVAVAARRVATELFARNTRNT